MVCTAAIKACQLYPEGLWESALPLPKPLPILANLVLECCRHCLPGPRLPEQWQQISVFLETDLYVLFPSHEVQPLGHPRLPQPWPLPALLGPAPSTQLEPLQGSPNPQAVSTPAHASPHR